MSTNRRNPQRQHKAAGGTKNKRKRNRGTAPPVAAALAVADGPATVGHQDHAVRFVETDGDQQARTEADDVLASAEAGAAALIAQAHRLRAQAARQATHHRITASRLADQTKAAAERQAHRALARAEKKAAGLITTAQDRSTQILRDARADADRLLASATTDAAQARTDGERKHAEATSAAEKLLATAAEQAERVHNDARTAAEKTRAEATATADQLREESSTAAEAITQRAQHAAETLTKDAQRALSDARDEAERLRQEAEAQADRVRRGAETEATRTRQAGVNEAEKARADAKTLRDDAERDRATATADAQHLRERAGRELQEAQRASQQILDDARRTADRLRAGAKHTLEQDGQAAKDLLARAQEEADSIRNRAQQDADRLREQARATAEAADKLAAAAHAAGAEAQQQIEQATLLQAQADHAMAEATSRTARRARRREERQESRLRRRRARCQARTQQREALGLTGVPHLSRAEWLLLTTGVLGAAGVSILGLLSSFTSLANRAWSWGWDWPWLLPVGIDMAIPSFTILGLLLIRTNMRLKWVLWVPRALTGATVYLNWQAAHTLPGQIGHACLTLLWVVFSEIGGHVYATRIGAVTGSRMDAIRRSRWILAPVSTVIIRRFMILWEETSYEKALERWREMILARAEMREKWGRWWRWEAPLRERTLLKMGELTPGSISTTLPGTSTEPAPESADTEPAGKALTAEESALDAPLPDAHPHVEDAHEHERDGAADERAQQENERSNPGERAHLNGAPEDDRDDAADAHPDAHDGEDGEHPVGGERARWFGRGVRRKDQEALIERRHARVRELFTELERRPEWKEIRDALTKADLSLKPVSRPTAQRLREEVERDNPALAERYPARRSRSHVPEPTGS
ncbi:DUF2637 domain-containing protein [Streptomyces syringium]|uniref:DUF2637 domain-containing protein n=1 Tax=Streptomyces syringium TaxID=76729 RepID=UPI00340C7B93